MDIHAADTKEYASVKRKNYRITNKITFCCSEMKEAWEERVVNFGEYDSMGMNRDQNVNIYDCSPYPEGAVWDEFAINYCPFCGEKINVIIERESNM